MINIMAYDFHGHFEPYIGHIAPLYASHLDTVGLNATLNVVSENIFSALNTNCKTRQ